MQRWSSNGKPGIELQKYMANYKDLLLSLVVNTLESRCIFAIFKTTDLT